MFCIFKCCAPPKKKYNANIFSVSLWSVPVAILLTIFSPAFNNVLQKVKQRVRSTFPKNIHAQRKVNILQCNGTLEMCKIKLQVSLCLTKYYTMQTHPLLKNHTMMYWGSEGIAPYILNLSTRGRLVVSFTSWLLYAQYLLD
jgi:hypothetical protein